MLRQQNAMKLATTGIERTVAEKKREEEELLLIRRKEITEKIEKIKKYSGSRYDIKKHIYLLFIIKYITYLKKYISIYF